MSRLVQALDIVIQLAEANVLDIVECYNDERLMSQRRKQLAAIKIVQYFRNTL
jgi:hypothetical protein